MQELHIGENDAGQRFDKYLKKLLAEAPGSFVYKMLRKKNITLNGKKADEIEYLFIEDGYTVDYNSEVLKTLGMTLADAYKDANDVKA